MYELLEKMTQEELLNVVYEWIELEALCRATSVCVFCGVPTDMYMGPKHECNQWHDPSRKVDSSTQTEEKPLVNDNDDRVIR